MKNYIESCVVANNNKFLKISKQTQLEFRVSNSDLVLLSPNILHSSSLTMVAHKSSKHTPFKKSTPTKSPKPNTPNRNITPKRESGTTYATPTKKTKLSLHESSPSKNLEAMCRSLKEDQTKLKNEVNELFRRRVTANQLKASYWTTPLLKLYDIIMEMKLDTTYKDQEGTSRLNPVVLIPDCSSDV